MHMYVLRVLLKKCKSPFIANISIYLSLFQCVIVVNTLRRFFLYLCWTFFYGRPISAFTARFIPANSLFIIAHLIRARACS